MNLLLLTPSDARDGPGVEAPRHYVVRGARALHVTRLLAKTAGDTLRVGVLGQGSASATIRRVDDDGAVVELELGALAAESPSGTHVILAMPRPKALSRILQTLASFGVESLALIDGWRVDGAYFSSPRLAPARIEEDLVLGLEQGRHTHLPTVTVHRGFRRFVEDELPARSTASGAARVLFHPGSCPTLDATLLGVPAAEVILAFGPEGGFIETEVESFLRAGFTPTTLGPSILRTEVALAAGLGQLELVRHTRSRSTSFP